MVYATDFDAARILTFFEFPTELWFRRLNPKQARHNLPRAKLRRPECVRVITAAREFLT
jgi:hypothetical protein